MYFRSGVSLRVTNTLLHLQREREGDAAKHLNTDLYSDHLTDSPFL